jgi:hypothetical protein
MAWRYGTGPVFRLRTGLDYAVMMRHEHVNTADEIESCMHYFSRRLDSASAANAVLSLYTFFAAGADRALHDSGILTERYIVGCFSCLAAEVSWGCEADHGAGIRNNKSRPSSIRYPGK